MDVAPRLAKFARGRVPAAAFLGLLVVAACRPRIESDAGKGGSDAGAGRGGARADGSGFGVLPSADGRPGDGSLGQSAEEGRCAFQAHVAERVPVDLVVLLDASGSMGTAVGNRTKWELVQEGLFAFLADPRSAGLGVGLQFFPLVGKGTACTTPADCGYPGANPIAACEQRMICAGPAVTPAMAVGCGRFDTTLGCPAGTSCVALGSCSVTGRDCTNLGGPCPGGMAGNVCRMQPTTCGTAMSPCTPAAYERLAVPLAELPAGAPRLVRTLALRAPGYDTPMEAAALGVINHLRAHLTAQPGRRAAMVVATDGLPSGCGTAGIAVIADALWAARNGSPPVPTYAIGVFEPSELAAGKHALDELASAGGTGKALLVEPGAMLGDKLQQALGEIRGAALPCEYTIPRERVESIDFAKVNVHFTGTTGEEDLPYVGRSDRCHPTRGGWYYDVDPASGGIPGRILACPASCARFKSDPSARLELRFGCKTLVIE